MCDLPYDVRNGTRPNGRWLGEVVVRHAATMCLGQVVSVVTILILAGAGTLAGVTSTVASLASVVSYPVLLALGLPPVSANVTNTVALMFTGAGAVAGSRQELAGQGRLVWRLGALTALGGAAGAARTGGRRQWHPLSPSNST